MTTTLTVKTIVAFKAAILLIIVSIAFNDNTVYAGSNDPSNSKLTTAFLYETTDPNQVTAFAYKPSSLNSEIERNPYVSKIETDEYMLKVKNSLLKDFNLLVQQFEYVKPEDANKILSTVMKMRILELDDKIDESVSILTILNWKEKFMFTKKSKFKVETEISSLERDIKKNNKERFIIRKLLIESEIKENETDNTKKTNRKINSI